MALLKCPECGGNVSSTVHTCIHCGYEFNVCPTCQAVVIKSASSCPSCGATIEDDPKNASIAEEVEESSTADHSEYETETKKKEFPPIAELLKKIKKPFGYYLFRTFNITAYVIAMALLIWFFISLVIGLIQLDSVLGFIGLVDLLAFMFISTIMFSMSDFWSSIERLFMISAFKKWAEKSNVNIADVVKSGRREYGGGEKHEKNMSVIAYAYRSEKTAQSPVKAVILSLLKLIQSILSAVMYLPLIYGNVYLIFTSPMDFVKYGGLPLFVGAIVVSIILSIIIKILQKNVKKGMEKHIRNIVQSKYDFNYD